MKRFVIERTWPEPLEIPINEEGRSAVANVISNNASEGVTWIHSYVSPDRLKTFCIYDGPSEEALRKAAARNGAPVTNITEVTVLNPYFYA